MKNLKFESINSNGEKIQHVYYNPSDFLSFVDYGNYDKEMLNDTITEFIYYGNLVSLKLNKIKSISDIYDYCAERE